MDLAIPLRAPAGAFFQVNRFLVPWLFQKACELIGTNPAPTWDLHAGVGFLASAAQFAAPRDLYLVEPYRPAARAARQNLPAAKVMVGQTAEDHVSGLKDLDRGALVITDPPRTGLSQELRKSLLSWRPKRHLMLACDVATWARDTAFFLDNGYDLVHLELVDLFPSTHHVEVIASLEAR